MVGCLGLERARPSGGLMTTREWKRRGKKKEEGKEETSLEKKRTFEKNLKTRQCSTTRRVVPSAVRWPSTLPAYYIDVL